PLLSVMHVEIVIAALPELSLSARLQLVRCLLLQDLERNRQRRPARFADQQVNVLRHENVSGNHKFVATTHRLQFAPEEIVGSVPRQQRLSSITTEGQKVKAATLLVTNKSLRHNGRILHPN